MGIRVRRFLEATFSFSGSYNKDAARAFGRCRGANLENYLISSGLGLRICCESVSRLWRGPGKRVSIYTEPEVGGEGGRG